MTKGIEIDDNDMEKKGVKNTEKNIINQKSNICD